MSSHLGNRIPTGLESDASPTGLFHHRKPLPRNKTQIGQKGWGLLRYEWAFHSPYPSHISDRLKI